MLEVQRSNKQEITFNTTVWFKLTIPTPASLKEWWAGWSFPSCFICLCFQIVSSVLTEARWNTTWHNDCSHCPSFPVFCCVWSAVGWGGLSVTVQCCTAWATTVDFPIFKVRSVMSATVPYFHRLKKKSKQNKKITQWYIC